MKMVRIGNQRYNAAELWKVRYSLLHTITSPKKIMNLIKIKYSEILKKPTVYGFPYSVFLEPSSYCNLRCPMCLKLQKNSSFDNKNMGLEDFKRIMGELGPTILTIRFWNYGESLINNHIFEMIKIAKKYKIFTVLSTNGILLDEEKSKKILESGLDFLIFSFDGASKETYEQNRKNGIFEVVLDNIKRFMELKKKMKKTNILVSVQFIIMKTNEKEIDKIKNLSSELGVDKLMLRTLNVVSEKGEKLLPGNKNYKIYEKADFRSENFCSNVWEETVINSTGIVTPCCMDAAIEHPMGNIYNTPFKYIWNGEKYINFRKIMLNNINSIKICNTNCYKKDNRINFVS